jgi:Leucine-rich repeat (LRR) protein
MAGIVWQIPTEEGREKRTAEIVEDNPDVENPTTRRPGRRLDLSRLPIRENLLLTILTDPTTYTSVTVLDLNDCGLHTLRRDISNMANLVRLRLHSNNLKTLPNTIGDLRYLERLSVYGNDLGSLPESFWRLKSLKILRLGGNNLVDEDLDVIQYMDGLEQLYLRQNYKLKTIPRGVKDYPS